MKNPRFFPSITISRCISLVNIRDQKNRPINHKIEIFQIYYLLHCYIYILLNMLQVSFYLLSCFYIHTSIQFDKS